MKRSISARVRSGAAPAQGSILAWMLMLVALAGTIIGIYSPLLMAQQRSLQVLQQRSQAREWALGAQALPVGGQLQQGEWHIEHLPQGLLRARHADGQGWWLRLSSPHQVLDEGPWDGREEQP